ncbi:MAG: hypothetical protein JXO22_13410, partial [Phycisphaerae bacterium]|nr:hypothetical protein [Phycisphaerae bacterium]
AVLLDVAENQNAWHRSRLRAAQAASRLLRLGLTVLPKLGKVGASVPRAHLEALLAAFCRRLSGDGFRRLAKALADLTGPAAKTTGDKLRTVKAVLATVTDTARILPELDAMRARCEAELDENSPETLRVIEQVRREIAEIDAQIVADRAHNSRGG